MSHHETQQYIKGRLQFKVRFGINLKFSNIINVLWLKAIVVGNSGVGKSCLARIMVGEDLKIKSLPTIGVEFYNRQLSLDGDSVKVSIYDTGKFSSEISP